MAAEAFGKEIDCMYTGRLPDCVFSSWMPKLKYWLQVQVALIVEIYNTDRISCCLIRPGMSHKLLYPSSRALNGCEIIGRR